MPPSKRSSGAERASGVGQVISGGEREKTTMAPTVLAMPLRQESSDCVHQLHSPVGGKPDLLKEKQEGGKDEASCLMGSILTS